MAEELFREKISKEEKVYQEAVQLQKAVSCVLRFERKVKALNGAARKFESLGDYKDAKERMEACREEAVIANKTGAKETYEAALYKKEQAKKKSDYVNAIEEFKRLRKKEKYKEEAKKQIQLCKKEINRLESRAAWKRRFVFLAVLAIAVFLFMQTPAYPFAKGVVHQQMGEYRIALLDYEEAKAIPWTKDLKASCHYNLALKKLEQGDKEEALKHLKKARRLHAARSKMKELEKENAIEESE